MGLKDRRFEPLRETLLRGGVAPRHVRRYLAELEDHLADLTARERDADPETAAIRARAALGDDTMLAAAMLAQPKLRSISARFPWLVFGILPPLFVIVGFLLLVIGLQLVAIMKGAYIPRSGFLSPAPAWLVWTMQGAMFAINFLIVPVLGFLLAWTAQRQRMKPVWPLAGMALILMLSIHGSFYTDARGVVFRNFGTIIPLPGLFSSGGPIHWPIFLAQATLLCLPLAWLWRARRKMGAQT